MTQVIGKPYETTDEDGKPVGVAEHIVAVTGVVDEVGDVFVPGVFADVIRRGPKPKGVSGHDWGIKVSKALEREEWMPGDPRIAQRIIPALPEGKSWPPEAGAVYVKAQYNLATAEGKRAYENAKFFGPEESFSVGYKVAAGGARKRGGRRYINRLEGWYEWSDVLHGANNLAFGLSVKGRGLLDSELEHSGGRLVADAEVKEQRYVRDSAYWGLPIRTPIRPGMKPRGPKAMKLRQAGEVPDPDAGTTTKPPPARGNTSREAARGTDPMADRPMAAGEARSLLRDAVKANLQHQRTGQERYAQERDEIVADLRAAGYEVDVDQYEHPSDVEELRRADSGGEPAPPDAGTTPEATDAGDTREGEAAASTGTPDAAAQQAAGDDPMADRAMSEGEARSLLRDAVKANIQARKHDRPTRFSEERDEILADLRKAGYEVDIDDYDHPSDVGELRKTKTPDTAQDTPATSDGGAEADPGTPPSPDTEADIEPDIGMDENRSGLDVPAGDEPAGPDIGTDTAAAEDAAPDEVISADDLADGEDAAADAHGLIEADDGELEVTPEVADRQDRVETLLDGGEQTVKALDDTQLADARRDVAAEMALQDELARRDRRNTRPPGTEATDESSAAPDVESGLPPEPTDATGRGDTAGAPADEAAPAKPKVRLGLAGAAEDYADALDTGDDEAVTRARARLESSLRRSRSESEQSQALRDLLAADQPPDPARVNELAAAMRDEARARRSEQAKSRRLAKRLERERLRSLLGQIDAEARSRGIATDAGPPNVGSAEDDGVLSAEDLAVGAAAAEPAQATAVGEGRTEAETAAAGPEPSTVTEPAEGQSFSSVDDVRSHLADTDGYTDGTVDWDSALLSPGGGLVMFQTTTEPPKWVIAHAGSGAVVARDLPGDRAGARAAMGALEQAQGPDGQPIDWTVPDADTLRQNITDAGFTPAALLEATRGTDQASTDTTPDGAPDAAGDQAIGAEDAVALLGEAVDLNQQAGGGENQASRRRDEIVSRLLTAGYPANVADFEQPDGTDMTPAEAVALLQQAVRLNQQAAGGENAASRERDRIIAELLTAGYPANVDDYSPGEVDTGKARAGHEPGAPAFAALTNDQLRQASDDDLMALLTERAEDDASVELLLTEMDRRQRDAEFAQAIDVDEQWRRLDELLTAGWDEETAVEAALGVPVAEQRRERAVSMLRTQGYVGARFEDLARKSYRDYVAAAYRAAEDATRGHLLTREAQNAGIDPGRLFSGPEVRARRWASDELKQWWDENQRRTFEDHKAWLLGGQPAHRGAEGAFLT